MENWDPILVYMCSTKLPKLTLSLWEQSIKKKAEIPTWLNLDSYLTERHRTLEAVDSFRSANLHHVQSKDTKRVAEFPKINSFQRKFPYKKSLLRILHLNIGFHIPPWMADALEVLNPTNAESAKRSILYGSATTFYG